VYARLDAVAEVLAAGVQRALAEEGVPVAVQRAGNLFSFAFGTPDSCGWTGQGPRDYDQVRASESWRYPAFFHAMLAAGVHLPPSPFEAWFISAAHDDDAVAEILDGLPAAAQAAAAARPPA